MLSYFGEDCGGIIAAWGSVLCRGLAYFSVRKPSLRFPFVLYTFSPLFPANILNTPLVSSRSLLSPFVFFFHPNQQWFYSSKLVEYFSFSYLHRLILAILHKDSFVACLCIFSFYFFLTITGWDFFLFLFSFIIPYVTGSEPFFFLLLFSF